MERVFHSHVADGNGKSCLFSTHVRDASNFAADQFEFLKIPKTKTNEEDVPAWWKE